MNQNYPSNNFDTEHASSDYVQAFEKNVIPVASLTRLFNFLIDIVAAYILFRVVLVVFLYMEINFEELNMTTRIMLSLLSRYIYYFFFELIFGRTLGKYVTGTKVVSADGTPPSVGKIVARTFFRFVPLEQLSFWLNDVGWHDEWSRTRVVKV